VSLRRQLFLAMMALVGFVLTVSLFNSIYNARDFFQSQMEVQVQDATTSLGLQISSGGGDIASIETTFNLLNDSGFYQRISYFDVYDELLTERMRSLGPSQVPWWFVELIDFDPVVGRAEIMSGWQRLGRVELVAHPAHAYTSLWQILKTQLSYPYQMGYLLLRLQKRHKLLQFYQILTGQQRELKQLQEIQLML